MAQRCKLLALFIALAITTSAQSVDRLYSNYLAALRNDSTFQYFLVVRVKNPHTGLTREYCTTGNFLKGALHREYKLDYDDKSIAKVHHMAVNNRNRYFEFKDDSARYNISALDYTMAELAQFEKKIDFDSLAAQIKRSKNWSTKSLPDKTIRLYAHALFNRGILTGENSCYGGQLKSVR